MTFDPDEPHDPELDTVLAELVANVPRNQALPGDDDLVARSAASAVARWDSTTGSARRNKKPTRQAWSRWMAAAIGGTVLAGVITATVIHGQRAVSPLSPPAPNPAQARNEAPVEAPRVEATHHLARETPSEPIPSVDVSALPSAVPHEVGSSIASARLAIPRDDAEAPASKRTAAEMFTLANEARRARDAAAGTLYRDLQRTFPSSPEAIMSFVTLGRLELDHGNAHAALAQFERYLETKTTELREDALVGRASALERLGRATDEVHAWELVLSEYPQTLLATHAKERLAALR